MSKVILACMIGIGLVMPGLSSMVVHKAEDMQTVDHLRMAQEKNMKHDAMPKDKVQPRHWYQLFMRFV